MSDNKSSRARRREAALERRRQWKLEWIEMFQDGLKEGKSYGVVCQQVTKTVERLINTHPDMKTEIITAWRELWGEIKKTHEIVNQLDTRNE